MQDGASPSNGEALWRHLRVGDLPSPGGGPRGSTACLSGVPRSFPARGPSSRVEAPRSSCRAVSPSARTEPSARRQRLPNEGGGCVARTDARATGFLSMGAFERHARTGPMGHDATRPSTPGERRVPTGASLQFGRAADRDQRRRASSGRAPSSAYRYTLARIAFRNTPRCIDSSGPWAPVSGSMTPFKIKGRSP